MSRYGSPIISIEEEIYKDMKRRLAKLKALEDGGVENWEYYNHSLRHWQYQESHREAMADAIQNINDLMTEAEVDYPAGRECGHSITFDEVEMAKYLAAYVQAYVRIENGKPND